MKRKDKRIKQKRQTPVQPKRKPQTERKRNENKANTEHNMTYSVKAAPHLETAEDARKLSNKRLKIHENWL